MNSMIMLSESELLFLLESLREQWENSDRISENPNALSNIERVGDNYMFCCPVHSESRHSCGIMISPPHGWNCFSCDAHGNLYSLVSHIIGGSEIHAEYYIDKLFYMGSDTQKPYKINQISYKLEKIKNQRKPKQYLSEEEGLKYSGIIHPYMYKRGFTNKVIKLYELGYDSETNSIVFPVRDSEGNIRFLQRRSITGKYFLNDKGVDKRDVLYGLYYILKSGVKLKEVTIVESATDVISCYLNGLAAVALMGRYLYDEMIPQLLRLRTRSVNLFLDNDKAGIEATKGIAEKLYGYGFNVRKCDWSINFKDANEVHLARSMDSVHFEPAFKALR